MENWIVKYPQILGEELLTITTEYAKFDKTNNRLDILAIDTDGKIVIIELKRDKFINQIINSLNYIYHIKKNLYLF
jgi:RecB family endonuclease NucS